MIDWEAIVREHRPAVWRTAYRLLGNRADADECFQETFLAALEASRRGPVRNWRGLLQRVAAARSVDRLRDRYRRGSPEPVADWGALHGALPTPVQTAEDAELSDRLREALSLVPLQQAEVFCLVCLEGWSYAEAAEHLG